MDNYLGEIRAFAFGIIPEGWHLCDGTLLPMQPNLALYSLIGTTFGGDGKTNFALPDLRGRVIVGTNYTSPNYKMGVKQGTEAVTLTNQQTNHMHNMQVEAALGNTTIPTNLLAIPDVSSLPSEIINIYAVPKASPTVNLNSTTIALQGGNIPHNNMQPFLVVNYCIATSGIYPQRP